MRTASAMMGFLSCAGGQYQFRIPAVMMQS
jgi:hypothetical protein